MDLVVDSASGELTLAWVMATVGNKTRASLRKMTRRDVAEYSIPRVCKEVTTLAAAEKHLRLTSNLLYGISLIFKQKVSNMAADVSFVYERLDRAPLAILANIRETILKKSAKNRKSIAFLNDDASFCMGMDFVTEWEDIDMLERNLDESVKRALKIKTVDKSLTGTNASTTSWMTAVENGEELFDDFLNKTTLDPLHPQTEGALVSFEFDENGKIRGHQEQSWVLDRDMLLDELNLEQNFNTVSATIEDMTKTGNSLANDPNFAPAQEGVGDTAEVSVAACKLSRKKRRLCIDDPITMSPVAAATGRETIKKPKMTDLFKEISEHQPAYLNLCYIVLFGETVRNAISRSMLPLRSRHPTISNLDSLLQGLEDIEHGRNLPTRRARSIPRIDEIPFDLQFDAQQNLDLIDVIDLNVAESRPLLDTPEEKIHHFSEFLTERMAQVSRMSASVSFQQLLPTQMQGEEAPVRKNVAANSFAFMLRLAAAGTITLTCEPDRLSSPQEVFVTLNK